MKEKEKMFTRESDFIEDAETQYDEWQEDLERLEDMVKSAGEKFERAYDNQIATLKRYLHDVEEQIEELESTGSDRWEEQRSNFKQAAVRYDHAYVQTIKLMEQDKNAPAGWLEGFTDRPPAGSAGWLEGTGIQPRGSEGWVEGMAERTPKSEGWTEGYGEEK